jgi:hypothetical protein
LLAISNADLSLPDCAGDEFNHHELYEFTTFPQKLTSSNSSFLSIPLFTIINSKTASNKHTHKAVQVISIQISRLGMLFCYFSVGLGCFKENTLK